MSRLTRTLFLQMWTKTLFSKAWFCLVLLAFFSTAHAAISDIAPKEGTIGTTFAISGDGFGIMRGTVFLGSSPCKVVAWSDREVECMINVPMPPGPYDVVVNPRGFAPRMNLAKAFTVRLPALHPPQSRPQFVSPGEVITVEGTFLGGVEGKRKVELESLDGKKLPCRIAEWGMNSITFVLPGGIPGRFNLRYTNGVGTVALNEWGTFAEPPGSLPPPVVGASYGGNPSSDSAAAVTYNNKLWIFWPDIEAADYKIRYRRFDGENLGDDHELENRTGSTEATQAQVTPIVVQNIMYIFYTGTNGSLYYVTYNAGDTTDTAWTHNRIPGAAMASTTGRFAAVWNFTRNCIEVYWTPNATDIYMKTFDVKTRVWGANRIVNISRDPAYPNVAPYLTAVFNQIDADAGDYVTYLAWDDQHAAALTELKDGVELHTVRSVDLQSNGTNRAPSLVDLGERYLAVVYNHLPEQYQSQYRKFDKVQRTFGGILDVGFTSSGSVKRAPNGAVFSRKVADSKSPTGYRMDTRLYALVEDNPPVASIAWKLVECEYLGYWLPAGQATKVDLGAGDNQTLIDNFPYWPIIGVVDMPPFVQNGHGQCNDWYACGTEVEINFTKATTEGISGQYSAGGYIATRARSPVLFHVSAGYSGGFENSTTFTYVHTDSIEGNVDGRIMAYYLAPVFNVYTLDWYDLNGHSTGISTTSMEIAGGAVRKEAFEPEIGPVMYDHLTPYLDSATFPTHKSTDDRARLDSYKNIDPTDAYHNFQSIADPVISGWAASSPGGFTWKIDQDHSIDHGFYADLKFGAKFKKVPVGIGVEGSVEILIQTKTQTGVEAITTLKNREPANSADPSRVDEFHLMGYWLKPSEKGYWVPENRKDMGDAPWFITYRVTDYWP